MVSTFLCVFVTVLFAVGTVAAQLDEIRAHFDRLVERDAAVFGGAIVTWRGDGGVDAFLTCALGNHSIVGTIIPMTLSSSFRTNTMSELFLAMVVAHLESTSGLPFARTDAIPREFLPPPYSTTAPFENPLFPGVVVSLDTLLLHTSSITEAGFDNGAVQTPGSAASLESFVEGVFANAESNGLWSSRRPGLISSHNYSRLNSALVTYILEKVLAKLPTPVSVAAFIHNTFIAPAGLSGTFLVDTKGVPPAPGFPAGSTSTLSGSSVQDVVSEELAVATSVTIHPAYASDYMYYTSALDIAKLGFELLLGGRLATVGDALYKSGASVAVSSEATGIPGVVARTLGLYHFNPELLCQHTSVEVPCKFKTEFTLHGWIVRGLHNQVAMLCSSGVCVVAEVSHRMESDRPLSHVVGLAMVSLTRALNGMPDPELEGGRFYGLYVFIGVFATVIVVMFGSIFSDYLIRPVRVPTTTPAPKPNLRMAETMGSGMPSPDFEPQFISPPVRRIDVYD